MTATRGIYPTQVRERIVLAATLALTTLTTSAPSERRSGVATLIRRLRGSPMVSYDSSSTRPSARLLVRFFVSGHQRSHRRWLRKCANCAARRAMRSRKCAHPDASSERSTRAAARREPRTAAEARTPERRRRSRISRRYTIEKARREPCRRKRSGDADHESNNPHLHPVEHHQANDGLWVRPQCETDTNLLRPLRDEIRRHTVRADCRENERQHRE